MHKITINSLAELFGEVVDISGIKIDGNTVLGEDIPIDSGEMLRILSRIESRYKFRLELKEILTLKTLGDVLEVINCRINKKNWKAL